MFSPPYMTRQFALSHINGRFSEKVQNIAMPYVAQSEHIRKSSI